MNTIVTISRQFGSGGRLIGKLLAKKLNIPFYDKEIIEHAAENSGLAKEFIKENEQKRKGFASYPVPVSAWGGVSYVGFDNLEAKIYAAEASAIESFAKGGACVMVGRCADYVLKDDYKCLNIYVYADMESRIKRVIEVYNAAPDKRKAQKLIRETDRLRARHYRYYTESDWGSAENYHLCIDSALFGIENCVDMLAAAYKAYDSQSD
ncbi:MAG: cytidylate kinase-like family protein [Clostridia bacterium]|nr:cytidylate kinase-like family protein [Clostridia bacterium]